MAEVISMEETVRSRLISEIKVELQQADKSYKNAERHYKFAGEALRQLKIDTPQPRYPGQRHSLSWKKFVWQEFGIHQSWADMLIKLAEGKTTLWKIREDNRQKKRKYRAQHKHKKTSKLRPSPIAKPDPYKDAEPALEERWQYSLANLCGDIISMPAYWNKEFPGWEYFDCPSHIRTLLRDAATALASISTTVTVGDRKKRHGT
jgi:hypothetical protein